MRNAYQIIESLDRPRLIAYVAVNAELLLPKYVSFVEREKWGDPAVMRQALDLVWQTATGDRHDKELRDLEDRCLAVCPDNDEFNDQGAYMACLMIGNAIYSALARDDEELKQFAGSAYEDIAELPATKVRERATQEAMFQFLAELGSSSPESLGQFRNRWISA